MKRAHIPINIIVGLKVQTQILQQLVIIIRLITTKIKLINQILQKIVLDMVIIHAQNKNRKENFILSQIGNIVIT